jgi:hypothetical protein
LQAFGCISVCSNAAAHDSVRRRCTCSFTPPTFDVGASTDKIVQYLVGICVGAILMRQVFSVSPHALDA